MKAEEQQQHQHDHYGDAYGNTTEHGRHSYSRAWYAGQIVQLTLAVLDGGRHAVAEVTAVPETETRRVFGRGRVADPFRRNESHRDDYSIANGENSPEDTNRLGVTHVIRGVQL